jgi:hypothetical protein
MTSGGWQSHEHRHGRHRRGSAGGAWTPAVRPTDTTPAHARHDGSAAFRATDSGVWPTSEVLTRRPGWPVEPGGQDVLNRRNWPAEETAGPEVPRQRPSRGRHASWPADAVEVPLARRAGESRHATPAWPKEQDVPAPLRGPRHAAEPEVPPQRRRRTISADMVLDTVPMGRVKHRRGELSSAIVYALPDTPPSGLRKFDLGTVPASVTPPRSWRKAAWFAVGTSAAVVLGLAFASAELMGKPVDEPMIDALPAYPTGPLTLEKLPNEQTTSDVPGTTKRNKPPTSKKSSSTTPSDDRLPDTVTGNTADLPSVSEPGPGTGTGTGTPGSTPTPTVQQVPTRVTVGPQPVTPTDPQKMGDTTEEYFRLVTSDPAAAHAMTTGGMARKGAKGIAERYAGVARIEVREITIDRNKATTTSLVKVVREDGTETVEERRLTFTWGGDPKITDDSITE